MKRSLQLNPDLRPVTLDGLKTWRDHWEQSPVEYAGNVYDADAVSLTRINLAIQALSLQAPGSQIVWTLHDNTRKAVNKEDLQQVIAAVAVRSSMLHERYNQLKRQDPLPNLGLVKDLTYWLPPNT